MPAAAWTIPCAHRLWEVGLPVQTIQSAVRPQSNEWDAVLDKNSGYIQNWNKMYSWGQDTSSYELWYRAVRVSTSARYWSYNYAANSYPSVGFRPVLEVLNADTLGSGGLEGRYP